jgi:hypothetical protein
MYSDIGAYREENRKHRARARAHALIDPIPPGDDPWLIPVNDGIVDDVAVDAVVNGVRRVRLTARERVRAATEIFYRGGTENEVITRLGLPLSPCKVPLSKLGLARAA